MSIEDINEILLQQAICCGLPACKYCISLRA